MRSQWLVAHRDALSLGLLTLVLATACSSGAGTVHVEPAPATASPAAAAPVQSTRPAPKDIYFEFQVEKPARQLAGVEAIAYPPELRSARVEGQVLAQFVVDTLGIPVPGSFKVLRSSHDLFSTAVRGAVPLMRFEPARLGGRPVNQLVQQPFVFSLPPQ